MVTFDAQRNWPRSIASGPVNLQYQQYDNVGNLLVLADARAGMTQGFAYDALDRLASVTSGGGYPPATYAYDVHGNRQTAAGTTYTYEPGTLRLASRAGLSFTYDSNGNLRTAPNADYAYTPWNMLESATVVGGTTTYAYDAADLRVKKATADARTYYLRGLDASVLSEWSNPGPSGQMKDYVYAGALLVAAVQRSTADDAADLYLEIVPNGPAVAARIATPGQRALFKFEGIAGRRYSVLMTATNQVGGTCTAWPLAILRPDGTTLSSVLGCGATVFLEPVQAPVSGTYTVVVDPNNNYTADVSLRLFDVVDATGSVSPGGVAATASLSTPGQKAWFSFNGVAGRRYSVVVSASNMSSGTCIAWPLAILKPDGTTLVSTQQCGSTLFLEPGVAPISGTYTVLVDPNLYYTADLSVRVFDFVDFTASVSAGGAAVVAPLTSPGQVALLSFDAVAGRRYSVVAVASKVAGGSCVAWPLAIRKPDGTTLASVQACGATTILEPVTAPTSGTYTIVVDPNGNVTATVTVRLHDVVDLGGTIVTNGAAVPLSLATPGQVARLTFAGTAGQQVTMRFTAHTIGRTTVRLLRADGSQITSTFAIATNFTLTPPPLSATESYTIVIDPSDARTGTITVAVTDP